MMGTKKRDFAPLPDLSLEELVPKDDFYRHLDRCVPRTDTPTIAPPRTVYAGEYALPARPRLSKPYDSWLVLPAEPRFNRPLSWRYFLERMLWMSSLMVVTLLREVTHPLLRWPQGG